MTECLIRSLCCQENMSYELSCELQKICGVHVVPTSNRHIKLFLWFWGKCLCINMIINCLCIPYQQSTSWTHWIPGLILLPACPLLVGESDWLRLSSTGPPPPSSCRGWTCWHESMSYSVDGLWGNVCRFSEEVFVQSQRNFSKTGNFVSLWT